MSFAFELMKISITGTKNKRPTDATIAISPKNAPSRPTAPTSYMSMSSPQAQQYSDSLPPRPHTLWRQVRKTRIFVDESSAESYLERRHEGNHRRHVDIGGFRHGHRAVSRAQRHDCSWSLRRIGSRR